MPDDQLTGVEEREAPTTEPTNTTDPEEHLEDPGKKALKAERDRANAAEREAKQLRDELTKRDKKADEDRQKEAEEQGKWKELAEEREANLTTVQQARDKALKLLKSNVDAQWDGLPEEVRAMFDGEDDDVLGKSEHMDRMKPIIDRLKQDAETPRPPRGNHGNPPPGTPDPEKTPSALTARNSF